MNHRHYGNFMAALSFVIWGLLPVYYRFLPNAAMDELLAWRIIGSAPVGILIVYAVTRHWPNWSQVWRDKKSLWYTFVASSLMCISWSAFTWALTHHRVIDASLGFFIGPLVSVALGVFVLGDKLSKGQLIAILLATCGVLYQVFQYGQLPFVALTMGLFFALYGLYKKKINYDWSTTLFIEALVLAPFALGYLLFKQWTTGELASSVDTTTLLLYFGSAPITILPLIFYSIAIRITNLSTVGLMQYIEPSLQFILAVVFFGELFDDVKAVTFAFIWVGLLLTIFEGVAKGIKRKRLANHSV
ncbi:TPA: EamA family transporter RarD [Vibrio parahaemolyticus]|uniref:EamA family transporter RarD n=1 Tax=Vibrio parahaemolyticus TaxID=670 RepID=UPI001121B14B|nr:EamA family transporter RarD [Vibrio parahaemolyticus]EHR5761762.1 EamA family transporter RarD [Vibrio parahaemolyticus]EJC6828091.1 EamA family transporter RarD [Vibrio parahaemolyticus]EJG0323523.1 EamA family transporter RarD [Vibrio parahaemolyticus]EJG2369899.1 EamA family transporter RarD [Vibrio parahaemolyticus]EKA7413542.1 EamA family transporter RarD [Vibrio parahaemolyticus]